MRSTEIIMGMPVTVEIIEAADRGVLQKIFDFFRDVDQRFSTYKAESEISRLNSGSARLEDLSADVKKILELAEQTKQQTSGYFEISRNGIIDPSGIVKGWAILRAADIIKELGFKNFYVDAGGDIQVSGKNKTGQPWQVGIRNPFNPAQIVKALSVNDRGIATSGIYERGPHIYNPKTGESAEEIMSLTVIGPDVYEADRFATAAFAMGREGINFIEDLPGFEAYMIDREGTATLTTGFKNYESPSITR